MARARKDIVLFRQDKRDKRDVYAVFPCIPATRSGDVTVYQHVGQHSAGDLRGMLATSRPATRTTFAPLARELRRIGYKLDVRKRTPSKRSCPR